MSEQAKDQPPVSAQELAERIKAWREDDEQGYDTAIELLCETEKTLGLPLPIPDQPSESAQAARIAELVQERNRAIAEAIIVTERAKVVEARCREQAEEIARLTAYVQHQPACYFRLMANSGDRCTCGLDDLLRERSCSTPSV